MKYFNPNDNTLDMYVWLSKCAEEKTVYAENMNDPICARIMLGIADDFRLKAASIACEIKLSHTMKLEVERSSKLYVLLHLSDAIIKKSNEAWVNWKETSKKYY